MFRKLTLGRRLGLGFGLLALMAAALVALAAFGLNIATQSIDGITGRLIPANAVAARGKAALLQTRAAQESLLSSIGDAAAVAAAKTEWDESQKALDQAMDDYGKLPLDGNGRAKLAEFRGHVGTYRGTAKAAVERIASGGFATAAEARPAVRAGDAGLRPAYEMLATIESDLVKRGNVVFAQVDKLLGGIMLALLVLCVAAAAGAALLAWRITRSVVQPVKGAMETAGRLADGDLRAAPSAQGADELAQMLQAMQRMQQSLAGIVGDVRSSAESIGVASGEVASGNSDLSQRTEQTAASLQQAAASMEQITGTVQQTAELARTADALARQAREAAQRGGSAVADVVGTMAEINSGSQRIAEIIGVIDGIAFQTNILALNAAVEAARAGEQGRGFAVVASEVRSLAQRSAQAAKEIKTLIAGSVEKVEAGSRRVQAAGTTMDEIVASVNRVGDVIGEISAAAGEQSGGIGQVSASVAELDRSTQQNAALVEQSAAAAESLREQAARLVGVVATFKLA